MLLESHPSSPNVLRGCGIVNDRGGTASHHRKSFRQQWLMSLLPSHSIGRLANANGLVAALVVATYLGCPISQMMPFPPTHNHQWGGTPTPTMSDLTSMQVNNRDPCLNLSPSPQPFTTASTASTYSGGRFDKFFHNCNVQQKCPQRKHRLCRVCWCHSP